MLETPHAGTPIAPPDRKRQIAADTSKAATGAGKERGGIHRNSPPITPCAFHYKEYKERALRAARRRLKPKSPGSGLAQASRANFISHAVGQKSRFRARSYQIAPASPTLRYG